MCRRTPKLGCLDLIAYWRRSSMYEQHWRVLQEKRSKSSRRQRMLQHCGWCQTRMWTTECYQITGLHIFPTIINAADSDTNRVIYHVFTTVQQLRSIRGCNVPIFVPVGLPILVPCSICNALGRKLNLPRHGSYEVVRLYTGSELASQSQFPAAYPWVKRLRPSFSWIIAESQFQPPGVGQPRLETVLSLSTGTEVYETSVTPRCLPNIIASIVLMKN